jgi:transposase
MEKYSTFVFSGERIEESESGPDRIVISVTPRSNSKPICSGCGTQAKHYDSLEPRWFEYLPLWSFRVFFEYTMRRVDCTSCGVTVEMIPWASGKEQLTTTYKWFLAQWAKKLSWSEVATIFHSSWDTVTRCVKMAVDYGLQHRDLSGIESIGVDEISRKKGHKYATVVYQIDEKCRRLLWIGKGRQKNTLESFFTFFGKEKSEKLKFVGSDMWKAYITTIKKYAVNAIHILDRFHIVMHLNAAVDKVRAEEARRMKDDGYEPVLSKTRWLFLKRAANLTEKQDLRLSQILKYNLKSVKAYLLKEEFQQLWDYSYRACAEKFLNKWIRMVMYSKIEPMKDAALMIRRHQKLVLNWFDAKGRISQGIVEGFNGKAKVSIRKSYGFRSYETMELALYHSLGDLPMPKHTHRFC